MPINPAHLHLLLNHTPVFFCLIGLGLLAYAMFRGSNEVQKASLGLLVLAGLFCLASYFTGEPAEVLLKNYPSISFSIMEKHEELALYALIGMSALALLSLTALLLRSRRCIPALLVTILVFGLAEFALISQVAQLGGKIRHEEILSESER